MIHFQGRQFCQKWLASFLERIDGKRCPFWVDPLVANSFLLKLIPFQYSPLISGLRQTDGICFHFITKTRLFKYTETFNTKKKKKWKISDNNSDIFHISAQKHRLRYSLEPPRWGDSNEYPHSMFLSRNKNNNVYPCEPKFYYIKVGFKGINSI